MTSTTARQTPSPIFDLCRRAGRQEYNTPGAFYLPELEASFVIRCLRRNRYDEGKGRLRRHLILISPPDTVKSSLSAEFLLYYCGAVSRLSIEGPLPPDHPPTFLELQGGTTWESLRGGYVDGTFTHPQLHDVDFLYASEFFSFFGHSPNEMMQRIDQFNVALEEGRITFNQKSAKGASQKARKIFAAWCQENGIRFNFEEATFEYDCNIMAIFCTRPFTDKEEKAVDQSGFLGRSALARWDPDDLELYDYYNNQFGAPDHDAIARIRAFNSFAWRTRFTHVPAPPTAMVESLVAQVNKRYRHIGMRTGRAFYSVRPKRDRQNIMQLLTAFAAARLLQAAYDSDPMAVSPAIPVLDYQPVDAISVRDHYEALVAMIEKRAELQGSDDPVMDDAVRGLVSFTSVRGKAARVYCTSSFKVEGHEPYTFFSQPELVAHYKTGGNSRQAAYRRIAKLREGGHISLVDNNGRAMVFRVADHVIEDAGIYTHADLQESIDQDMRLQRDFDDLLHEEDGADIHRRRLPISHMIHRPAATLVATA